MGDAERGRGSGSTRAHTFLTWAQCQLGPPPEVSSDNCSEASAGPTSMDPMGASAPSSIPGGSLTFSQGALGLESVGDTFKLKEPQFGAFTFCCS